MIMKCLLLPFKCSFVPRPPPFFVLNSVWRSVAEAEEREKRGRPGNTYHVNDVRWTRGGRRGGAVPNYKYGRNKPESEFLTGQAEYS